MARAAKVKCPHCGKPFIVRQQESEVVSKAVKESMDGMAKELGAALGHVSKATGHVGQMFSKIFTEKK